MHVMENIAAYCKLCGLVNLMHLLVQLFQYYFFFSAYKPVIPQPVLSEFMNSTSWNKL